MESEANEKHGNGYDEVIVFDMKQMEQKQRPQNYIVGGGLGSSVKKRAGHQKKKHAEDIEMAEIQNPSEKYKKQGLGGYEEEESLDNSGRID